MNVNVLFVVLMVLVGAAAGAVLWAHPELNFFAYTSYFAVLVAMAALELGLMLSGKLKAPISLEVRLAGLVLGIVASAAATAALPALAAK